MLERIAPLLPPDWKVIVQFDSWYASKKILKFVDRHGWQFTCGVKSNRKLNGVRLDEQNRKEKHKWHTKISVTNAKKEERSYYVRPLEGRLEEMPFDLRVLISKRHAGQKNPAYFASTRVDCKPQAILQGYSGRWSRSRQLLSESSTWAGRLSPLALRSGGQIRGRGTSGLGLPRTAFYQRTRCPDQMLRRPDPPASRGTRRNSTQSRCRYGTGRSDARSSAAAILKRESADA